MMDFNFDHIRDSIAGINCQINDLKCGYGAPPSVFPPVPSPSAFHPIPPPSCPSGPCCNSSSCSTSSTTSWASWTPPNCSDPLVSTILDVKYELQSGAEAVNGMGATAGHEVLTIVMINQQLIEIRIEDPTGCPPLLTINGLAACKIKRIIYNLGLTLRAVGLPSSKGNFSRLLDFLTDLGRTTVFYKPCYLALLTEMRALIEAA